MYSKPLHKNENINLCKYKYVFLKLFASKVSKMSSS
jgi:hypothetical protein